MIAFNNRAQNAISFALAILLSTHELFAGGTDQVRVTLADPQEYFATSVRDGSVDYIGATGMVGILPEAEVPPGLFLPAFSSQQLNRFEGIFDVIDESQIDAVRLSLAANSPLRLTNPSVETDLIEAERRLEDARVSFARIGLRPEANTNDELTEFLYYFSEEYYGLFQFVQQVLLTTDRSYFQFSNSHGATLSETGIELVVNRVRGLVDPSVTEREIQFFITQALLGMWENSQEFYNRFGIHLFPSQPSPYRANSLNLLDDDGRIAITVQRETCDFIDFYQSFYRSQRILSRDAEHWPCVTTDVVAPQALLRLRHYWSERLRRADLSIADRQFISKLSATNSYILDRCISPSNENYDNDQEEVIRRGYLNLNLSTANELGCILDAFIVDIDAAILNINERFAAASAARASTHWVLVGYSGIPDGFPPGDFDRIVNLVLDADTFFGVIQNSNNPSVENYISRPSNLREHAELAVEISWYSRNLYTNELRYLEPLRGVVAQNYSALHTFWILNNMRQSVEYTGPIISIAEEQGIFILSDDRFEFPWRTSMFERSQIHTSSHALTLRLNSLSTGQDDRWIVRDRSRIDILLEAMESDFGEKSQALSRIVSEGRGLNAIPSVASDVRNLKREFLRIGHSEMTRVLSELELDVIGKRLEMAGFQLGNVLPHDDFVLVSRQANQESLFVSAGESLVSYRPLFEYSSEIRRDVFSDGGSVFEGREFSTSLICFGALNTVVGYTNGRSSDEISLDILELDVHVEVTEVEGDTVKIRIVVPRESRRLPESHVSEVDSDTSIPSPSETLRLTSSLIAPDISCDLQLEGMDG